MTRVNLAYMAYDVHELACHFVASHAGLYKRYGLEPELIDAKTATGTLQEPCFRAACAAALAGWLAGDDTRVVFVAAERPIFWLYGAAGVQVLSDLRGNAIAGYPPHAPPALFLGHLLGQAGISDVEFIPVPDDETRLGMLADGSVAAALLSSRVAPGEANPLLFLGDEIPVATTGLAVSRELCSKNPELVAAMCACYNEALALIHNEPGVVLSALRAEVEPVMGTVDALVPVLRACYTNDGRSSVEYLQSGAEMMAAIMGVDIRQPVAQLYNFAFLD